MTSYSGYVEHSDFYIRPQSYQDAFDFLCQLAAESDENTFYIGKVVYNGYYFDLVDIKPSAIENFMQRKIEIDKEVVQNRLKNGIEIRLKAINDLQALGKISNLKLNFENELVKININIDNKTRYEYLKNSGQSWCYMKLDDGKFDAMTSVDRLNFVLKRAIEFIETT